MTVHSKKSAAAQQQSFEALGKIFDYMLEGCQIISPDFRYLYVNEAVVRQSKHSRQDLLGKTMMECYPGIEKTEIFRLLKDCMVTKSVHTMDNKFEFPDGSTGWFEVRIEPLPEGAIILSIDITDRKHAERRSGELDDLKNTFIKIVSHQLRTPLTATGWNLEELLHSKLSSKLSSQQLEHVKAAYSYNQEVASRLGDLLRALDIEEDRIHLKKAPTDLESLLRSTLLSLEGMAYRKRLHLQVKEPHGGAKPLILDAEKIRDAVMRLISNALNYSEEDTPVHIRLSYHAKHARIEIVDTGIGIPENEQAQICNRFYRASNAFLTQPNASGLGLFIAQHHVALHGGTLGFHSKETKGSTFWIDLPLNHPET